MSNTLDKYLHLTEFSEPGLNNQNLPKNYLKKSSDKHIGIKRHQKAIEKYTNYQSNLLDKMSSFIIQAKVNKLDIIAKMHCIYLCTKKHLAIEVFLDLMKLTNL
ncbi:hypothetical protein C2G38_2192836 [Gigaspora rosea]|uniref:Uncharacterized protein n=1 Tax=Gigaspora rosea TaxID=44941 RepID=A0A397UYD1_9GLOM|nr:hypothetical protein C2G38_2192836 [Gigaspora rosea]